MPASQQNQQRTQWEDHVDDKDVCTIWHTDEHLDVMVCQSKTPGRDDEISPCLPEHFLKQVFGYSAYS